jgi:hypothetical protein
MTELTDKRPPGLLRLYLAFVTPCTAIELLSQSAIAIEQ